MNRSEIRVAVIRIEGTNCEEETVRAFRDCGVFAETVHLKQFYSDMIKDREQRSFSDYNCIAFPGGFSAGDYVRAGAIFSARLKSVLGKDLEEFIKQGYPVIGICNGFQVLAELGVLPGFDEDKPVSDKPEMALAINDSCRFECRPSFLRHENRGKCVFTWKLGRREIVMFPVAHAEGKVVFPAEKEEEYVEMLRKNDQIVFRYVDAEGNYSGYPWNPNGSVYNIAGICNITGNVLGMMPHPERAFWYPNTQGRVVFESVIEYMKKL